MATFTASAAQSFSPAIYRENAVIARTIRYMQTVAQSAGDVVQMVTVPKGATINLVHVAVSFSAGAITVNIGDGLDTSKYGASVVLSGSVVALTSMPHRGLGYSYSAEDTIDLQMAVVSAPPTSAVFILQVMYTCQNDSQ